MARVAKDSLGYIIKQAMIDKGLNQSAIAAKMGLRRQSLNQIERRKTFDMEFLQRLKDASGLDFTNYDFNSPAIGRLKDPAGVYTRAEDESRLEMTVTLKVSASPEELSKLGEFVLVIRREAKKQGFTII